MNFDKLQEKIISYNPNANMEEVRKAFDFASLAHEGQIRYSGEPYIKHPLNVAYILAELELDETTVIAGLLHDVVEDTKYKIEDIEKNFGKEVALIVDGVTKLSRIEYKSKMEQQVENYRKMFLAMAQDIRVILTKLADRLHNMRTLRYQPEHKQKEIAEETIDIFAPLAHRLGIFRVKSELEDLSLRYLEPEKYYALTAQITMKRKEQEAYINEVISILGEKLENFNVKAEITGRAKNFYSIYKKMTKQNKDLSEIYDLIAVRVIVDSIKDCYGALGIIHTLWKPIPGRFKDYIAMPKANLYQSLHTTVVGHKGDPFEVQIRTMEMHRIAEYGIAAHWTYKEGKTTKGNFDQKLTWLRQVLDLQQDTGDAREFMDSLRVDLFSDMVYVFTPKGDVVELPNESTPIDFAYHVHTEVGHNCVGAKINSKIVPIDYKLQNGDIVEILTLKGNGPSRDWLKIVKTSQAKNRIRNWFKKEFREEHVARGRELLEKEARKQGVDFSEALKQERLLEYAKKYKLAFVEDLYSIIGEGSVNAGPIIQKIKEDLKKDKKEEVPPEVKPWTGYGKPTKGVRVKGIDNCVLRMSRCCNPLPGDSIVGYITRGRGVSIHREDCPNIINHSLEENERLIDVAWDTESDEIFQVELEATSVDRPKLAMEIMTTISDTKTVINSVHARATKNKLAVVTLKIEIRNLAHLDYIMEKVRRIKDVLEVRRITPK